MSFNIFLALNARIYRQNQNRAEHSTELFETEIVDESYFEKQNYDELF